MTQANGAPDAAAQAAADAAVQADIAEAVAERDAEIEKWKTQSRKHEDQAKANLTKAQQFDALQAQSQSVEQKLQQQAGEIAQLRDLHAQGILENARAVSAARYGLVPEDMQFLTGGSAEEIDSAAKALADRIGAHPGGMPPLFQGPRGGASAPANNNELLRSLARGNR